MTNFDIDKKYAFGANEGSSDKVISNQYIILHETTNVGGWNNAEFLKREWWNYKAYVQYVIGDGGKIYQLSDEGYIAWAAGDYVNYRSPVQIELARTYDKATFEKDYAAFINFARAKAVQYGIPLTLDTSGNGVKTHLWVSNNIWGNHQDPVKSYLQPTWGITQEQLAHDIATGIGGNTIVEPAPQTPNRDQVTIKHGPITGIAGWTIKGTIVPGSNTKLVNASNWKTAGIKKINGLAMYKIATDEFVPKKYTDQAGIVTINAIAGIAVVNSKGDKLDEIVKDLTQWKTDDVIYNIAGRDYFKIATDEYVDAYYTMGGGNH